MRGRLDRVLRFTLVLLVAAGLITAAAALIVRKNAREVYVGETKVGVIKQNKKVTEVSLRDLAVNKIENDIGMNIRINEAISFKDARSPRKSLYTDESVISAIASALTYKVEAAVILVGGEPLAALKSMAEADEISERILDSYAAEGSNIISKEFVEDVKITLEFIEPAELTDYDRAYRALTASTGAQQVYIVREGDSLWQISLNTGMTLDELYELNPGLKPDIFAGQRIQIVAKNPILSVRTVEEVIYEEEVKRSVEYIYNDTQPRSYSRTVQQGRDGKRDAVCHIERVNGLTVDSRVFEYIMKLETINDVIEVGIK